MRGRLRGWAGFRWFAGFRGRLGFQGYGALVAVVVLAALCAALAPAPTTRATAVPRAVGPVPLERLFDNTAVSDDARPDAADFDGSGASLSAQDLAAAGWTPGRTLTVRGAHLTWPRRQPGEPDNVRADGQDIGVAGRGDALVFLVAGTGSDTVGGPGTVSYADGSRSAYLLTAPDWRTGPLGTKAVALPHVNTPDGQLAGKARLYVVTVPLAQGREVVSVRLPRADDLHVFAVSVRATTPGWSGSWAAATSGLLAVGPWADRTVRLVVHTSVGGPRVRLRFDNTFAATLVRIGRATVAVRSSGAQARGTPVRLSFRGAAGADIPAGAQAFSDPLSFAVPADADLLVSFHLPQAVSAAPVHRLAVQRSYVSEAGDHTADRGSTAYTTVLTSWPLLTGVDVGGGPGSVVLLGDSITDGDQSTMDTNRRWPNVLATRLLAQAVVPRYGVLNQGISANRVVSDRYPGDGISTDSGGVSALNRFDRDVLAQTSVRTAVVFQGVNDVRWGATADQVIAGLRELAGRGRAHGLRMLAATILPCRGEARCTAAVDVERVAVNSWIREAGVFDGVLDFDEAVRDPAQPARMLPAYDSGDHLHPGDAGLAALAESVDLSLL
ncbi:secreted protein [Streptomyces lincolnensis]|uniref:Secreted protein n=1 Tax=Streptomyces lincolnensis TaxID=1915 RepID=A0A1B1MK80_STRLN|nr:SGNH/GDSL hydrolase family protein [Streptomyces lincolnensis]ANS69025.1 secreted protein [Streptomyces lincolnensis]AXG57944.1 secreted protein [Streptomyces lincolnensis]QMV10616.1 SGNH/GDSL hydrolase family protein [Streptomyces lincolnensis]